MQSRRQWIVAALAATVFGFGMQVGAAETGAKTEITISGELCGGCLKKIKAKLSEVADIADVQGDFKAKIVTIVPKQGSELSPRTLWDAVEKADKKPTKLAGPSGTFTTKPKS